MGFCIIYDLDGTLIDSRRDLCTGVNLMRKSFGLEPLALETVVSYVGNGARNLASRSITGTDIDLNEALARMKQFYAQHLTDDTYAYEGVQDGVKAIHRMGIPQAVITNKQSEAARRILDHFGILECFEVVIGGGDGFPLKPEPDSLLHVANTTGSDVKTSWIVGDNYTDLESGRRAGMQRCYAAYGFGNPREETYETTIRCFGEFAGIVLK